MFTLFFAVAAALTGLVSAQNNTGSYSSSGPLYVDPNSVDLDLRRSWCTGQRNNCPLICAGPDADLGDAFPNDCDPEALTYTCTCANGNQPNISDYTDTLPFYICQRWRDYCTAANPNDLPAQTDCQSVTCGTRNASAQADSAGGSSASASGSPTASSTPSASGESGGSSEDSPSTSSDAAQPESTDNAATAIGVQYGTGILVGGMLALFGLAL